MSTMLRITQVGSPIGRTRDQRATVRSLGLRRIRHTVIQPDRPEIRGMLQKVPHLVTFEEIDAAEAERLKAELEAPRAARATSSGPRARDLARATARARRKAAPVVTAAEESAAVTDEAPAAKKTAAKKTAAKKTAAKKTAAKKTSTKSEG